MIKLIFHVGNSTTIRNIEIRWYHWFWKVRFFKSSFLLKTSIEAHNEKRYMVMQERETSEYIVKTQEDLMKKRIKGKGKIANFWRHLTTFKSLGFHKIQPSCDMIWSISFWFWHLGLSHAPLSYFFPTFSCRIFWLSLLAMVVKASTLIFLYNETNVKTKI